MDIKVIYIGNDNGYWQKLQKRFLSVYPDNDFQFKAIEITENLVVHDTFKILYKQRPDIIYVDYSYKIDFGILLSKWITRNNEMRLASLVGLFDNQQDESDILRGINATVRVNHIKSTEIQDVVYDPISLLNVNMAQMPSFVRSNELPPFEILQPLRVGYIEENKFHIETNSYLNVGDIVDVDQHPLTDIMPSTKVFVQKFYKKDLYYNMRFAYDLEFIYIDDDFFVATNEKWKLFKHLKENPKEIEELKDIEKIEIIEDMDRRKKNYAPTKKRIDEWIKDNQGYVKPKKVKIMVVDDSLEILNALKGTIESLPYTLNLQTVLLNDYYQISRTMPHLIVLKVSKKNNDDTISEIIATIKKIEEYEPYILLFCSDKDTQHWRNELSYEQVLSSTSEIELGQIKSLGQMLESRVEGIHLKNRVFLHASDKKSTMFLKRNVKILGMTESILYLESPVEIPMWTIFMVRKPIKMLLTIVPHKDSGAFANQANCYRCLINGVSEIEKAEIRRMINLSLADDE